MLRDGHRRVDVVIFEQQPGVIGGYGLEVVIETGCVFFRFDCGCARRGHDLCERFGGVTGQRADREAGDPVGQISVSQRRIGILPDLYHAVGQLGHRVGGNEQVADRSRVGIDVIDRLFSGRFRARDQTGEKNCKTI